MTQIEVTAAVLMVQFIVEIGSFLLFLFYTLSPIIFVAGLLFFLFPAPEIKNSKKIFVCLMIIFFLNIISIAFLSLHREVY